MSSIFKKRRTSRIATFNKPDVCLKKDVNENNSEKEIIQNNDSNTDCNIKMNIIEIRDSSDVEEISNDSNIIKCLEQSIKVNIVKSNGNKYVFTDYENDNVESNPTYDPKTKYGFYKGKYTLRNIPEAHPMAILNKDKTNLITYTGNSEKMLKTSVTLISISP